MAFFASVKKKLLSRFTRNIVIIVLLVLFISILYHYWPWRYWTSTGPVEIYPLYNIALFEVQYHLFGSLFIIPIICGIVLLWWRGALVALILVLAGGLTLLPKGFTAQNFTWSILFLIAPVAIVSVITLEIRRRIREHQIYTEREKERQIFLSKVIEAQENERRRISLELHDDTMQNLALIVSYIEDNLSGGTIKTYLKTGITQTINDLRRISRNLRPPTLEKFGLVAAVNFMINQMRKDCKIEFSLKVSGDERKLSSMVEINSYRIVQEALNNIKQHSKAIKARVKLEYNTDYLSILIKDNGQGFRFGGNITDTNKMNNKFGLIGMAERCKLIDGTFHIESSPGKGTLIHLEVPCENSVNNVQENNYLYKQFIQLNSYKDKPGSCQ